jgi:hypothetical protein
VLRYVAEPVDAGGFEGDIWVQTPGHGPVDDGLLLFIQYLDKPPPVADEEAHSPVQSADESDYRGSFYLWR